MKKLLLPLSLLLASCAEADMLCPCDCVPVTPTVTATATAIPPTVTPTPTNTPQPTATIAPSATPTLAPTATSTPLPVATVKVISYQEDTQAIFPNPEIGFESTQKPINDPQIVNPFNIPSTQIEFGQYIDEGYTNIDAMIPRARAANQTILLRIAMCDPDYGRWLKGVLPGFDTRAGGPLVFCADLDNAQVLQRVEQAIAGYGQRYNNNPTISHVDIRIVGLWGEWHYSATNPQVPMPSEASSNRIINAFRNAFPNKHVVAILDGKWARKAAAESSDIGIRMDCFGGNKNHEGAGKLYDQWYADPPTVVDVWRHGPVIGEPCGPLNSENVAQRADLCISRHYSLINTKNGFNMTSAQYNEWARCLRKIGYRFFVRQARINGGTEFEIINVGIAPNYSPIELRYGGEVRILDKVLPGQIVTRKFSNTSGTLTADMKGRVVRFANVNGREAIVVP